MNKKAIQLIVLIAVLALLVVGYLVISTLVSDGQKGLDASAGEGTTALSTYNICTVDQTTVHTISCSLSGTEYRYTLKADATGWEWSEDPALPLDNVFFANMVLACTDLTSTVCLTGVDEQTALTEYGLDPASTIHFEDEVNGAQTFRIGVYNSFNNMYYFCRDNDPSTVYMVDATLPLQFLFTPYDMVAKPSVPTDITRSKLQKVTLTSPDGAHTLVYTYYVGGKVEGEEDIWYVSRDGGEETRVDAAEGNALSTALTTLAFSEVIDYSAENKAAYGLDTPAKLIIDYKVTTKFEDQNTGEITSIDTDHSFTLLLGNIADSGLCYATIEDSPLSCTLMGEIFAKIVKTLNN